MWQSLPRPIASTRPMPLSAPLVRFTKQVLAITWKDALAERDRGCIEGLMLCPADRGAIYLGKLLGNLLIMAAVEAILLPLFFVLFNLPAFTPGLLAIVALGTVGFAALGTLFSAVAVNTRTREVMLPGLLFP